ncbi:MAG: ATP-binding domain-containing protein [Kibdelosporangium sp.]
MSSTAGELSSEIDHEQGHLTALYAHLDGMRAEAAQRATSEDPEQQAWQLAEVARLDGVQQGLCFGRLDLADGRRVYIGRIGLFKDSDEEPLLLDWRAPAARPFYTATAAAADGVRRRRRITTRGRQVVALNDEVLDPDGVGDDGLIGEAALLAAVSAGRGERMTDIVTTLQAEQDRIIRDRHLGVLVVQGGPGTGKTAVALHRIAHLLYARPQLRARGVLVVGPSRIFLEYIGQVLPGLGESSVVTATVPQLCPVAVTSPDTDAERKGRASMADHLAATVRAQVTVPDEPIGVEFEQQVLRLAPEDCRQAVRRARRTGMPHNQARLVFQREIVEVLAQRLTEGMEAVVLTDTGEALDGGDADGRLTEADLRALEAAGVVVDWTDSGPRQLLDEADLASLRATLLADTGIQAVLDTLWPALTPSQFVGDDLSPADIPLLDEAAALIEGVSGRTYGHVVVDEAQELSEMAWRMLMRRCPSRSMTIVGDLAQTGSAAGASSWERVLRPHVADRWHLAELTVNYRTPAEIMTVANDMLAAHQPGIRLAESIRSTGETPWRVETTLADLPRVAALLAKGLPGRVAVIAPAEHQVPAPVVLTPTEAKGLEFDSVLVVDPAAILAGSTRGHNDLYVALTRATHRLGIVHPGPPPPELAALPIRT